MTIHNVKYADVASTVAAIAALAAASKKAGASSSFTLPPEVLDALGTIIQQQNDIIDSLQGIGLNGITVQGWADNADYVYTGRTQFVAPGVAVQLPLQEIPSDFSINIKAYPTNGALTLIYVATSLADATNPNSAWPLMPNESVSYRLKKTDQLYVASNAAGTSVIWTVELKR